MTGTSGCVHCVTVSCVPLQELQSRLAAQKLSEALKVSMGSYAADTGPMAAYRETQDDEAQPSSEED